MKASRLLSIMMMLQARGRMSAAALAQVLEVSERTILRDMDQLSAAGVPLWGDRGRLGGFQLREGWSTELTGLTEPEVQALFLGGLPGPATELGLGAAAVSARLKMVASLPAQWREQADRVSSRLHIDPVDWYRSAETPAVLREAAQAVWNGLRIEVQYESWRKVSKRQLEPLGLVLKAGAWYLVARQLPQGDPLTFRLANVRAMLLTQQRFKRPRSFDLAAHWSESLKRFEKELYRLTAHVAVSPRGQKWLDNARVQVAPTVRGPLSADLPLGWKEYLMPIESVELGARQLMGYGAQLVVLGPKVLQEAIRTELDQTLSRYADRKDA